MNVYTDEFIKLAKLIQADIEPEVGMWFIPTRANGTYIKPYPILIGLIERNNPEWPLFRSPSYPNSVFDYKVHGILLPDLGWLVRRLRDEAVVINRENDCEIFYEGVADCWFCYVKDYFGEPLFFDNADTPELACLKAYIKIKGYKV